jgi:hypothetical protein
MKSNISRRTSLKFLSAFGVGSLAIQQKAVALAHGVFPELQVLSASQKTANNKVKESFWASDFNDAKKEEITGSNLSSVIAHFEQIQDFQELKNHFQINSLSSPRAVHHVAKSGNTLTAVVWEVSSDTLLATYQVAHAYNGIKSRSMLVKISGSVEAKNLRGEVLGHSINGKLSLPPAKGVVQPKINCGCGQSCCPDYYSCTTGVAQYSSESYNCTNIDMSCIYFDCGPCVLTCAGGPVLCGACVLLFAVALAACCKGGYYDCATYNCSCWL